MDKKYTSVTTNRTPRPRSKRLRECNVEFPSAQVQAQGTLDLTGKVDVDFFSMLFEAQDSDGNAIRVNSTTGNIHRLRVKCNLFSDFGVSALGYGPGGGGGGDTLTEPLATINNAGLGTPTAAGQAIVWDGSKWTFGTAGSGTDLNAVWTALAGNTSEQINATHLSNALSGYATQDWVNNQGFLKSETYRGTVTSVGTGTGLTGGPITSSGTISISQTYRTYIANGQTAYGWGNHANAGYLTGDDIQDMATKTWVANTANAASAAKLQTARSLWGNQFDGTQNIDGTITIRNNSGVRIYDNNNQALNVLTVDSGGNFVVGETVDIYGHNTYIRGANFYWQSGTTSANRKALMILSGSGNLSLRQTNAYLGMESSDYGNLNVLTLNTATQGDEYLALGYGVEPANYVTRIYGGGGGDKGIRFYHGTTLSVSVEGGDHSFLAYYNIKLTTNNQCLYTRNTNGTLINTVQLNSNNILNFGYGCSAYNHETRIYGGATAGIGFFCGSTEVASVYRNVDSGQHVYQGIRIGNALLSWDSANNALKVQRYDGAAVNFYSLGGVSGLGFTAPQSSLDAFRIDYLTSTNISTQTVDVATQMNLGSANCNIQANTNGSLTINAPAGLTLVTNSGYGLRASRFYLDATRYIYLDGTTLKYYNGSQSKTIVLS